MSAAGQLLHATIEVDPIRTLLVLGPQVTALCLSEAHKGRNIISPTVPDFLSYNNVVENGILTALELDNFHNTEARERRELLLKHAYELEPAFAMHKVIETLKSHNSHDRWINEVFKPSQALNLNGENSRTLQHLLYLRRKGVRIIYTYYDDILARALGLPVVLLDQGDEEGVRKWSQGFPALLQLHGIYTEPHSVRMDCLCYQSVVGTGRVADIVREQFQSRTPIFIGYDSHFMDPFLSKIISSFATCNVMPTSLPLLLSLSRKPLLVSGVLPMALEPNTSLSSLVKISKIPLCVAPINDSSHPVSLQLICTSKEEVTEIFELLRLFSNVLTNLTKRENNLYIVDLQMNRQILQKLWLNIFSPAVINKLQGLMAVELQGSFVINLSSQKTPVEETVRTPPSFPPSLTSLTTPTSLWKMPPVSSLPHFTVPSLIPDTQKQLQLLGQALNSSQNHFHAHEKLIQSESPLDIHHLDEHKNGFLIHQHNSPTFSLGTPFLLGHNKLVNHLYTTVSNTPSLLVNRGEKKVKVEQQQPLEEDCEKEERDEEHSSFENKKEEFIREAQEWSKQVSSKIKTSVENTITTSVTTDTQVPMSLQNRCNGIPLVPLNATGHFPIYSSSPHVMTTSSNQSHNPSTFLLASPQSTSIFNMVSPPTTIPGTILPPSFSFIPKLSTVNSPTTISGMIPKMATPTLASDQKFVYMMQDGKLVTTPFCQEAIRPVESTKRFVDSPKRARSPNSDPEHFRPPKQRRRSSSLPDTNQLKTSPSPSPASPISPSLVAVTTPISGLPVMSVMSGTQATPPIFFSNMQLPQTDLKLEQSDDDIGHTQCPSAEVDVTLHPVPPGRGPIQLWQFLLEHLLSPDKVHLIQWTGNGYEFQIVQPEEIAKLWGARKNKPRMNYDKLSRGLRYYYSKGIMDKVPGKKLTFKYTCDIQQYILQRSNSGTPSARLLINSN